MAKFPSKLIIETTTKCNAKCIMCPMGKIKRPKFMDVDEFCGLIDECAGHEIDEISLTGYGDPLCDTYLSDRISYISGNLPGTTITIFTNGYWMTPDVAGKLLDSGLNSVTFSVDGVKPETYEQIRVGLRLITVERNIYEFIRLNEKRGHPCNVRVHMTIMSSNRDQLGMFMGRWRNVADEVTFAPCDGRGKDDREPVYESLATPFGCQVVDTTLNVMSDGEVVMCCQDFGCSIPIGNAFRVGIENIWNCEALEKIRELHHSGNKKLIPLCAECNTKY